MAAAACCGSVLVESKDIFNPREKRQGGTRPRHCTAERQAVVVTCGFDTDSVLLAKLQQAQVNILQTATMSISFVQVVVLISASPGA